VSAARRRAALVTGGSAGIGLAIAKVLAEEGHDVTIAARDRARAETAAGALRALGADAVAHPADIGRDGDVEGLVDEHLARFGALDVLVNNAGHGGPFAVLDALPQDEADRIFAVNLRGTYVVTRMCLPLLRDAGARHGRALVVNTTSIAAKQGLGRIAAYSATKAAVVALSQALRQELAEAGVRVTALCPALTATPMSEKGWARRVPLERMLAPEDLGEVVRLLLNLSPRCEIPEVVLMRAGLEV